MPKTKHPQLCVLAWELRLLLGRQENEHTFGHPNYFLLQYSQEQSSTHLEIHPLSAEKKEENICIVLITGYWKF